MTEMAAPSRRSPVDQSARDAAIKERARNVLIDARAGTGKTTTLVTRLVEMVAPSGMIAPSGHDRALGHDRVLGRDRARVRRAYRSDRRDHVHPQGRR